MTSNDRFDRNGIVRLFENDSNHMLASLGILFSTTADDAESDGCDEYWWRTAGMTAVIREIDRRLALAAAPVPQVPIPEWVTSIDGYRHEGQFVLHLTQVSDLGEVEDGVSGFGKDAQDALTEALQAAMVKAEVAS